MALDRPGLLYDISSTFAEHGFNIEVGLIDTEGGTATDVFYVTQDGAKLTTDRQHELQIDAPATASLTERQCAHVRDSRPEAAIDGIAA